MKTPICDRFGCEVPIFAFSHCRDVVVEVTKAGGFGVLGAVTFSPEQLERELKWIDEHVGGRSYGVDVLIPVVYDRDAEASAEEVVDMIPVEQKQFVENLLDAEGVPPLSHDDSAEARRELVGRGRNSTPSGARKLIDVALAHPQIKLVVSALGAPPKDLVDELHARGILVGSLCGKAEHARAQRAAGVDIIVAPRHRSRGAHGADRYDGAGASGGGCCRPRHRRAGRWRDQPRSADCRCLRTWCAGRLDGHGVVGHARERTDADGKGRAVPGRLGRRRPAQMDDR